MSFAASVAAVSVVAAWTSNAAQLESEYNSFWIFERRTLEWTSLSSFLYLQVF